MSRRAVTAGCLSVCWLCWGWSSGAELLRAAPPGESPSAGWQAVGRSAQGLAIYAQTIGAGPRSVLVLAGLSGVEPSGPVLADYFAAFLRRRPEFTAQTRVTIVHALNPDGLLARTGFNRRGVELDRNFPTRDWVRGSGAQAVLTGPAAGSEPETQLALQLIAELQPELLIVLGGSPRRPGLAATSAAAESARQIEQLTGWPAAAWPAEERPGALLTWAAEHDLAAVLMQIPFERRTNALWSAGVRALATLCDPKAAAEYERGLARGGPATVAARPVGQAPAGGVLRYAELSRRAPLAQVALPQSLRADRRAALQASSPAPAAAPVAQGRAPAAAGQAGQPAVQRLPPVAAEEFPAALWQSPQTPIPAYPPTQTP